MKYIIPVLFFCLPVFSVNAQVKGKIGMEDTTSNESSNYISDKAFRKKVRTVYGQLATGQTNSSVLANYADADIADGKLGFNGVAMLGKTGEFVLSLGANGKINNSVAQLFNGFKLNSNASLDLRLNLRVSEVFYYDEEEATKLKAKVWHLKEMNGYLDRAVNNESMLTAAFINTQAAKLFIVTDSLRLIRDSYNPAVSEGRAEEQQRVERDERNKMRARYYELITDSLNLKRQMDSANQVRKIPNRVANLLKANKEMTETRIEEAELAAPFSSIHMSWVTLRINPSRQDFYLYDSLQPLNTQVIDSAFTTAYYGLEFSYYYWSNRKKISVYTNIGLGYQKENNLDSLDSYEITDKRKQALGPQEREVVNKYKGYVGDYNEFNSWKLYANLYVFNNSNKAAFHFFPEFRFWGNGLTVFNSGIGFVISFKSKKDEKTIINAEPYVQWYDIGNKLKSDEGYRFKRNFIGVKLGLPINPYENKKG